MAITLYQQRAHPPEQITVNVQELAASMRKAAYLFWVSERRNPAAVVVSTQLAQALTGQTGVVLVGEISSFGFFEIDGLTVIPLLARPAFLDPLFQFL